MSHSDILRSESTQLNYRNVTKQPFCGHFPHLAEHLDRAHSFGTHPGTSVVSKGKKNVATQKMLLDTRQLIFCFKNASTRMLPLILQLIRSSSSSTSRTWKTMWQGNGLPNATLLWPSLSMKLVGMFRPDTWDWWCTNGKSSSARSGCPSFSSANRDPQIWIIQLDFKARTFCCVVGQKDHLANQLLEEVTPISCCCRARHEVRSEELVAATTKTQPWKHVNGHMKKVSSIIEH